MPENAHPWRVMTVVFGAVLVCSYGLERLASPAADAVVRVADTRPVSVTGTIDVPAAKASPVLRSPGATYTLSDPAKARAWAGRQVRITGVLHESTGVLEIRTIDAVGGRS
jgi:hypothetical protein